MAKPIAFLSPDKRHKAVLTPLDESPTDHSNYSLSLSALPGLVLDRVFGKVALWSPDSRFLAVQEWKEERKKANELSGSPRLCVLLILDVMTRRECIIANVEASKGRIFPESFIGESLMYTVVYFGQFGMTKSFETKFRDLHDWQALR